MDWRMENDAAQVDKFNFARVIERVLKKPSPVVSSGFRKTRADAFGPYKAKCTMLSSLAVHVVKLCQEVSKAIREQHKVLKTGDVHSLCHLWSKVKNEEMLTYFKQKEYAKKAKAEEKQKKKALSPAVASSFKEEYFIIVSFLGGKRQSTTYKYLCVIQAIARSEITA
ncbi:hypothetical protein FQA39_LY02403 [Lamprigera yunnana]|nr:hypothetical protein FQA39_LY02403 [Lamprigera yunnana]